MYQDNEYRHQFDNKGIDGVNINILNQKKDTVLYSALL
jgi:hypothetical protein